MTFPRWVMAITTAAMLIACSSGTEGPPGPQGPAGPQGKQQLGATSLVITPDVASAFRVGDSMALMHEGISVAAGGPEEFRRSEHPAVKAFLHNWLRRQTQGHRAG